MFLPPEFKDQHARGIDSDVRKYTTQGIKLSSDYGMYSGGGNPDGWKIEPEFQRKKVVVDGLEAEIVSFGTRPTVSWGGAFDNMMCISFLKPTKKNGGLTIFASCKNKKDYATLEKIFSTIHFK